MKSVLRRALFDLGLFSLATNLLLLVMPIYLMQVYDRVLPSASIETLIYLSLIALLSLGFLGLIDVVRAIYANRVGTKLARQLGGPAFDRIISAEPTASTNAADPISSLRDIAMLRTFVGSKGLLSLFDLPFAPLFAILLYFVHPALFLLTVVGIAIMFALLFLNLAAERKSGQQAGVKSVQANATAQSFARHADTIRAMGMKRDAANHWGTRFADSLTENSRVSTINSAYGGVSRTARMVLQLAILGVGGWLVISGEMTAGMIFACSIISGRALQPIDQVIAGWRQIGEGFRAWRRLAPLAEEAKEQEPVQLPEPKGSVTLENVIYHAPGSQPGQPAIIKRINVEVAAGNTVAVIGPSRAGKTTLARLIVGAIQPTSGVIRIDGADLKSWNLDQRRGLFGYLAQDVQLFPGTIAQNICRFDPTPDDHDVVAAAQAAHAHDLILSQSNGYQTDISGAGPVLSGGERQRIGLARAFYQNPRILVLDEPNANLDADGEKALLAALSEAKSRGVTVFLITHRLALAARCDNALLLREGATEAYGPSADVLEKLTGREPANAPTAQSFKPGFSYGPVGYGLNRKPGSEQSL